MQRIHGKALNLIESGCRIRKMRPVVLPFSAFFFHPNKLVAGSADDLLHANQFGAEAAVMITSEMVTQ